MGRIVACLMLLFLFSGPSTADHELYSRACELVYRFFPSCLDFLVGVYYKPSPRCCKHIDKLNILAKHRVGPRTICYCIEYMVRQLEPRLNRTLVDELPVKCHTQLSFPISEYMDCSSIPNIITDPI